MEEVSDREETKEEKREFYCSLCSHITESNLPLVSHIDCSVLGLSAFLPPSSPTEEFCISATVADLILVLLSVISCHI